MEIKCRFRSSMFPRTYSRGGGSNISRSRDGYSGSSQVSSLHPGCLRLRQFLGGGAQRLARMDRLRYGGRQTLGFEAGQRGLKIASGLPNSRSSFPAMRAPRPGVSASANQPKYWSGFHQQEESPLRLRTYGSTCQFWVLRRDIHGGARCEKMFHVKPISENVSLTSNNLAKAIL